MNQMHFVVGDWSDDGHGKSDKVLVEVNKTVKEIQDAYKASCKLTGISFNHNEDFTGVKREYRDQEKYLIATEWDSQCIYPEAMKILLEHNCPVKEFFEGWDQDEYNDGELEYKYLSLDPEDTFIELWFWFVKLSLPDLKFQFPTYEKKIPTINGYWDKDLNVQFGYGLYH